MTTLRWMERALCRGLGADLFFPDKPHERRKADNICKACPVRVDCLEYALAFPELVGIWAGTNPNERDHIRYMRGAP